MCFAAFSRGPLHVCARRLCRFAGAQSAAPRSSADLLPALPRCCVDVAARGLRREHASQRTYCGVHARLAKVQHGRDRTRELPRGVCQRACAARNLRAHFALSSASMCQRAWPCIIPDSKVGLAVLCAARSLRTSASRYCAHAARCCSCNVESVRVFWLVGCDSSTCLLAG